MAFGWLKRAVQSAGRPFASLTHTISNGIHSATELVAKVPIVGQGLHGVFTIAQGPFNVADNILRGQRIDRAVLSDLKNKVGAIQDVAPYAQTILSVMPAVGPGINGAIGTGLALAEGMPIDKALLTGIKDMVPGGPLGRSLFSVTQAAIAGENIPKAIGAAAIDQLRLPPQGKKALQSALNVAYRASKGDNIPKAALEEARTHLPNELKPAYDAAIAVGQGRRLQDAVTGAIKDMAPSQLGALSDMGKKILDKTPVFREVYNRLDSAQQTGYRVGQGLLSRSGVNAKNFTDIRKKLTKVQQLGFDLAASTHIAAVMAKPPPRALSNKAAAGYYATHGMVGAHQHQKASMLRIVTQDPEMVPGVALAIREIKIRRSLWQRIKAWFGIHAKAA